MPNGEWSGTTVSCQGKLHTLKQFCNLTFWLFNNIATCKIEDAIKNEKVKVDPVSSQYVQDDEIIIFCNSEYTLANSSKPFIIRICLSNQTWSGIDPLCEKGKNK